MKIDKENIADLAIFGGKTEFSEPLFVGRPNIGNREKFLEYVNQILDTCWLTNAGPLVAEFELRIAELLGVKHCIAMCNGTVALEITIRATRMKGEVIVPSFTFVATAHALQWQEITPIFCDIQPGTYHIDPSSIERMITPKTTGIIGVHLWGQPCNIELLTEIAERHQLQLIFDAAHAFGSSYKGKMIGNFGKAEVFSFHATKCLNTFEGGLIATNDDKLATQIRLMKNFGFAGYDYVVDLGTNGKMSEICAGMGLVNLDAFSEIIEHNHRNYLHYKKELVDVPGISVLNYDEKEKNNYQYIVLDIDERKAHLSRDQLLKILHQEKVLARRYFYPGAHRHEPYVSYFPHAGMLLPETERASERTLCMPTGTSIGAEEIEKMAELLKFSIKNSSEIRKRLV